ncbi:MAG TPA: glycosyltransferase family 4 protein [Bryobacteraceae bacterium]|nr:glycosyltransferase family 4 protein [Bryobacteraceae bacterium]
MILYTAAHGGFSSSPVPLGGGAAVFEHLVEEWTRTQPFPFRAITPAILGKDAPSGRDLVGFNEKSYARFSRAFERAATDEILRHDPAETIVLSNDVSEGPDFTTLAKRGFRVFTIYHVDVVAYVAEIYGRGMVRPETLVRWYPRVAKMLPDIARLIWEKQAASVRGSRGLIVPSEGMREVLLRCYPDCPAGKIHVLPWGSWGQAGDGGEFDLQTEFGVPREARVLLTLSRISPEKGQDLLLDALADWEQRSDFPDYPLWLFVCGEAAFMQGGRFLQKLQAKAARLRRTRVVFPGYVTGARKSAFFRLADVYVFPSRHESYGLTLMEALEAGVPAVCLDHHGARSVMREEFGAMVPAAGLRAGIQRLLGDDAGRKKMGEAARNFARSEKFSTRAAELAELLTNEENPR